MSSQASFLTLQGFLIEANKFLKQSVDLRRQIQFRNLKIKALFGPFGLKSNRNQWKSVALRHLRGCGPLVRAHVGPSEEPGAQIEAVLWLRSLADSCHEGAAVAIFLAPTAS